MGRRSTRPEDWRLAPTAAGTWAGTALGVSGAPPWVGVVSAALLGAAAAVALPRAKLNAAVFVLSAVLGVYVGGMALTAHLADPASNWEATGGHIQLVGRLITDPGLQKSPWGEDTANVTVQIVLVRTGTDWVSSSAQVRVTSSPEALDSLTAGDTGLFAGKLSSGFWDKPPMVGQVRAVSVHPVESANRWHIRAAGVREGMVELAGLLPEPAGGLILGMSVGNLQLLDTDTKQAMRTASLTHLTAISGTHISIALLALALVFPGGVLWRPLAGAAFLAFLISVVGPSPSVLRSASMAAVAGVALVIKRPPQPQVALAVVVIMMVLLDPWKSVRPGFAMSVLATAGILRSGRRWARKLRRRLTDRQTSGRVGQVTVAASQAGAIAAAASLWVAPILVAMTGTVPLFAVPANVLAAPAVGPVTLLGLLAAILVDHLPGSALLLVWLAVPHANWIAAVAQVTANIPGATLGWPEGPFGLMVIVTLVGLVLVFDELMDCWGGERSVCGTNR